MAFIVRGRWEKATRAAVSRLRTKTTLGHTEGLRVRSCNPLFLTPPSTAWCHTSVFTVRIRQHCVLPKAAAVVAALLLSPLAATCVRAYRSSIGSGRSSPSAPPPLWYTFWMIGFVTLCSLSRASSYSSLSALGLSSRNCIASFTAASTALLSSALSFPPSFSLSFTWLRSEYATLSSEFRASTRSRTLRSSSSNSAASRTMRSISSSLRRPLSFVMVISSFFPDDLSTALTCRMLFSSTSKVTSICGTPRGAGGMPDSSNLPSRRLSFVICRSPS
ncbi:putative heat-shock protein hsp70 [Trypanosoma cruzi]|nr:hypothetical protein ECC02_006313 [Trypanosoma cruzi]KAF5220742.1 hypothetical protein ECC02_006314 [Trypanosoma cruzi]KAF5220743.1 hypothetical protein ECC02_006315 [Trypanosoma cruzi]PWV19383.1 putative heat-shock protein hsp70 [Trypanosoma cruzi]PWV19385.1 putative heat-shock protein hsp70 [Trypanosoma cruzi]